MLKITFFIFLLLSFSYASAQTSLMDINSWAYQLQNIEISQIAEDRVSQLIVMDYSADGSSDSEFTSEQISRIKSSEKKVIVFDLVLIGSHFGESTVATP
ncbi:hypothetical protein IH992_32145 [Candidatus Poribacteria bacterium]|nr:hypothetical protein [Candidatus Poribacteria bacterium]